MNFACCDEHRKAKVLGNPTAINGIDYLEVLDHAAIPIPSPRQQTLLVTCLKKAPPGLTPNNVLIVGGESITGITALWVLPASAITLTNAPGITANEVTYFNSLPTNVLVVRTSEWGDFSQYTFRLVNDATAAAQDSFDVTEALSGFDPQLAQVSFSFKVECGPNFDCEPVSPDCPPDLPAPPPINYLAKDYGSFRQVILDRLNQLLPGWNAATGANVGVMLAELLAYAGDQLSYRQDAVATEAYLTTARSRISLRRHAKLVNYQVHEGCNSRVWIQINVPAGTAPVFIDRTETQFYTSAPGMPASMAGSNDKQAALTAGVVAFEPMHDANLYTELNVLKFHTWGDSNCCLPKGATGATLKGTQARLQVGDVLIFEEVLGPQTGLPADADIRHRCAVRLTAVATQNAQGQALVDPLFDVNGQAITSAAQQPMPVTEIQWGSDDALPFPVCVSSTYIDPDQDNKETPLCDVSIVLGNVMLADQGLTMPESGLEQVPEPTLHYPPAAGYRCTPSLPTPLPVRYRPRLADSPITQAVPLPQAQGPSTANAVPLVASGYVSLKDKNGFVSLMIAAKAPLTWPQYFGVTATANAADPSLFDLAVVFVPPGSAAGTPGVALERFVSLSVKPADANYAVKALSGSRLVQVPSTYVPPAMEPPGYPGKTTMLQNAGTVSLLDTANNPFFTLGPTNPLGWPPLLSVLAQTQISDPSVFNLFLLYAPSSGGVGVTLPVTLVQANGVSLANASTTTAALFAMITIETFEGAPNASLSAQDLMSFDAGAAVPAIALTGTLNSVSTAWTPESDLLADGPDGTHFVLEVDTDGTAQLRFGDDTNGKRPASGTAFSAVYRIGNGVAGNVGADSITNMSAGPVGNPLHLSCTNPLPAIGGIDPETNAQIRRRAPQAFLTQERAVTMNDYVIAAQRNPQIEDAYAVPRWTGSWYTIFITAEPQGNASMSKTLRRSLTQSIDSYRLAGEDILVEPPQYVSLDVVLSVCVDSDYFQLDVAKALLVALGSGTLSNNLPGYFAPQNFDLGQTVYLSPIYAAARAVAGVSSVTATTFQPQGANTSVYLQQGYIPMNAFQVARLDNDPSLPDHGQLRLQLKGGK